ncbi:MAG TPA: GNAT family N-acetyltransferase, partial [Polyangiaceae bacterium]
MVKDIRFRRGTPADSRRAFDLSMAAVKDLMARQNHELPFDADSLWSVLESYLAHLATHAAEWWIAEDVSDGSLVGYARSVERGGLFELSELFVRPGIQSAGLGKQLIERAFPRGRGEVRAIIATNDVRALARYYAADTVARFPIASLTGKPKPAPQGEIDVTVATPDDIPLLAELETAVVGYGRDADYPWLLREREGLLYRRGGRLVGSAFFGEKGIGPIATYEPADQRFILADMESRAHARGIEEVSFSVPMVNEIAMNHLFGRGFKIDGPLNLFMS